MKRSEINAVIHQTDEFLKSHHFHLPPFAHWSPNEWAQKGPEAQRIVEHRLGWDMTDFGCGDFRHLGLAVFTIRNGAMSDLERAQGELYCEKIIHIQVEQVTPLHFHWSKTEDIINRGGGTLVVQLYNATQEGRLREDDVTVFTDSIQRTIPAGGSIRLEPGESITLCPHYYHAFWAEGEPVLAGEVSLVNDDQRDNRFYEAPGRFPSIEEDEPPLYLLVTDYDRYYRSGDTTA